jgi:hypothetical protein
MTTIVTKNGSGAPLASDLVQGELAVDLTNKRLYTEDSGGTVIEVGTSPSTIDINAGTIDGTVIGGASAAAGTFTTFTSTGIDDNATSTAITIDSSENVMDGSSGVSDRHLIFSNSNNSQQWDIDAEGGASSLGVLSFSTNSTERMRIDSSGNLLVGKTSTSFGVEGALIGGGVIHGIRDGAHPLALNRLTDDGDLVQFYKDSSLVGSIASVGGTGIRINSQGSDGYLQNGGSDKYTLERFCFCTCQ